MPQASESNHFSHSIADLYSDEAARGKLIMRSAIVLGATAIAALIILFLLYSTGILPKQQTITAMAMLAILSTILIVPVIWLVYQKQYNIATALFLYGTIIAITVAAFIVGGTTGPISIAYFIPILAGSLFGNKHSSLRLFFVALVCFLSAVALQNFNILTPMLELNGISLTVFIVLVFIAIGWLLSYLASVWSSSTSHFLSQANAQSDALFESNQKLIEKNIQQVELGSELSTAASELLAASHQQASGATQQASAVSEVSITIEELGSTARQIAAAGEQVAEAASQTLENLSDGQEAVDKSIEAMERIRNRMRDVSSRVLNLGERSQQIGEIIDLINDLSDETHLLALNAAIEAAGAGEHGRRFAVVAAEVKSLANRALTAAKEVKGVIAEIQQATNSAVLAAEEGGKEVEVGVELAHSAGEVMNTIVLVAERTAQSGAEISLATAQQQSASDQVVETMREIADVARQTAAGSRQMADAAQMLTAIAERLHGLSYNDTHIAQSSTDTISSNQRRLDPTSRKNGA